MLFTVYCWLIINQRTIICMTYAWPKLSERRWGKIIEKSLRGASSSTTSRKVHAPKNSYNQTTNKIPETSRFGIIQPFKNFVTSAEHVSAPDRQPSVNMKTKLNLHQSFINFYYLSSQCYFSITSTDFIYIYCYNCTPS